EAAKDAKKAADALKQGDINKALENQQAALNKLNEATNNPMPPDPKAAPPMATDKPMPAEAKPATAKEGEPMPAQAKNEPMQGQAKPEMAKEGEPMAGDKPMPAEAKPGAPKEGDKP